MSSGPWNVHGTSMEPSMEQGEAMIGIVKRTLLCGGVAAVIALTAPTAVAQSSGAGSRKAEDAYKNIQVLKGVPADQVIPAMQFFTASLGVDCEFCHDEAGREKDTKRE